MPDKTLFMYSYTVHICQGAYGIILYTNMVSYQQCYRYNIGKETFFIAFTVQKYTGILTSNSIGIFLYTKYNTGTIPVQYRYYNCTASSTVVYKQRVFPACTIYCTVYELLMVQFFFTVNYTGTAYIVRCNIPVQL